MVDVLESPSAEFEIAAAPTPRQRDVTLQIDADLLDWLAARGDDAGQEINGLLRFYKDTAEQKEREFAEAAFDPAELWNPAPQPP